MSNGESVFPSVRVSPLCALRGVSKSGVITSGVFCLIALIARSVLRRDRDVLDFRVIAEKPKGSTSPRPFFTGMKNFTSFASRLKISPSTVIPEDAF